MSRYILFIVLLGFLFIVPLNAQQFNELERKLNQLEQNSTKNNIRTGVTDTSFISNAVSSSACRLYSDIGNLSSVITIIPVDTRIFIVDIMDEYYYIKTEVNQGFVRKSKIIPDQSFFKKPPEVLNQQDTTTGFSNKLEYLRYTYGWETAQKIFDHKIWRNMTTNMVEDSWGRPDKINRLINSGRVKEKWFYPSTYLIFMNDKLIDWGPVE
ncbi:MAG: hypothetical protein KAT40_05120 [Bacteroidales bacterium]|nr:hypothetical protein [Bacteroidales bacterium]